jgi:hypothetical protein
MMATIILLNTYLLIGIEDAAAAENKFLKLSRVGLLTIRAGGKANNSSIGLKACAIRNIIGITINNTSGRINA